jgi:23S rRNA U2552 (ribose-2'-O)-methylase RlmE/FtsJ
MDPLLRIASNPVYPHTVIKLPYFTSSIESMTELEEPYGEKPSQLYDEITLNYNKIRDLVDGLLLPHVNNRAENKLRNLLTICPNLLRPPSEHKDEWTVKEILTPYNPHLKVADIASAPGSWSALMLNTYPNCTVFGYTLWTSNPQFMWYPFLFRHPRFTAHYGDVVADNLNNSIPYMDHFDLCLCDGGAEGGREEIDMMRLNLLAGQFISCLRMGKPGSSAAIKFYRLRYTEVKYLINMMACAYERATIVKLLASRSLTREYFVIFLNRKDDITEVLNNMIPFLSDYKRQSLKLDPKFLKFNQYCIDSLKKIGDDGSRIVDIIKEMTKEDEGIVDKLHHETQQGSRKWVIPAYKRVDNGTLRTLLKIKQSMPKRRYR